MFYSNKGDQKKCKFNATKNSNNSDDNDNNNSKNKHSTDDNSSEIDDNDDIIVLDISSKNMYVYVLKGGSNMCHSHWSEKRLLTPGSGAG